MHVACFSCILLNMSTFVSLAARLIYYITCIIYVIQMQFLMFLLQSSTSQRVYMPIVALRASNPDATIRSRITGHRLRGSKVTLTASCLCYRASSSVDSLPQIVSYILSYLWRMFVLIGPILRKGVICPSLCFLAVRPAQALQSVRIDRQRAVCLTMK